MADMLVVLELDTVQLGVSVLVMLALAEGELVSAPVSVSLAVAVEDDAGVIELDRVDVAEDDALSLLD